MVTLYTVLYHCSLCYNHYWLERAYGFMSVKSLSSNPHTNPWRVRIDRPVETKFRLHVFCLISTLFIKQLCPIQLDSTVMLSSKMWCTSIYRVLCSLSSLLISVKSEFCSLQQASSSYTVY